MSKLSNRDELKKNRYLCVEYDSEYFTSLWILQVLFQDIVLPKRLSLANLIEVEFVKRKPLISFIRDTNIATEIDNFALNVGYGTCRTLSHIPKEFNRPHAVVICLNPDGVHGNCRLSNEVRYKSFII